MKWKRKTVVIWCTMVKLVTKYQTYSYKGEEELTYLYSRRGKITRGSCSIALWILQSIQPRKNLNLDIEGFLKAMGMEFVAYGSDNYWITPGNFFFSLFNDVAKDYWYFLDYRFSSYIRFWK